jgi:hypothetical protein
MIREKQSLVDSVIENEFQSIQFLDKAGCRDLISSLGNPFLAVSSEDVSYVHGLEKGGKSTDTDFSAFDRGRLQTVLNAGQPTVCHLSNPHISYD